MVPSEFELIDIFAKKLGSPQRALVGIGDDTAVFACENGSICLFATDMIVEDIHFKRSLSSLEDVGWKAMAVNVSDIAAMGGVPRFATVAVALPSTADAEPLYKGLAECAARYGVEIVGGDTVGSLQSLIINVSIIGFSEGVNPITRNGAQPGDVICVTGSLGAAAAGLEILLNRDNTDWPRDVEVAAVTAHRRPEPRVAAGRILGQLQASAMMDLSDGLAGDAQRIAAASNVAMVIDVEKLPIHPSAVAVAAARDIDPLQLAMSGGEDFELLACLPVDKVAEAERLLQAQGIPLAIIGRCEQGSGVWLRRDGYTSRLDIGGFDHFMPSTVK